MDDSRIQARYGFFVAKNVHEEHEHSAYSQDLEPIFGQTHIIQRHPIWNLVEPPW